MSEQTYDRIGAGYCKTRRSDPRIAGQLWEALGDARSVLNVGAGAGAYEPTQRRVVAVEPSLTMIRQRPYGAAPCVRAVAEALPFADDSFDAIMGALTVHQWTSPGAGLREMRRVARGRIVLFTWDPQFDEQFWLTRDYWPEILALDRRRYPPLSLFEACLGPITIEPVLVPFQCCDGFRSAYWKRPEAYLDPAVQRSISAFALMDPAVLASGMARLKADLDSREWERRNQALEGLEEFDAGYRLVISTR